MTADRAPTRSIDTDRAAVVLAAATFALVPIARGWVLWSAPGADGDINQWVTTSPFDWPLAILIVLQAASALEDRLGRSDRRPMSVPTRLLVVTLAWMALCAVLTPSWRAVDLAFHVAGAWAVVRTARRATPTGRNVVLAAVTTLGFLQAVLGIAQSRSGRILGLGVLEFDGPLYTFGASTAGRGSLTHPYHLTAVLIVCVAAAGVLSTRVRGRARGAALLAVGVMGAALPLTFSRAVVLAVVPMALLWGWSARTRVLAGAMVVGVVVGGLLGLNGISAKGDQTINIESADSGRRQRAEEAINLVEEEPVFGVGPGRYVIALRDVEHDDLLPPHNIVLHAAAEAGIIGGALAFATLGAFGVWLLRRRSAMVLAAGLSLLPFHLLDSYPHVFPVGLLVSGMWLAVVWIASATDTRDATSP